MNQDFRKVSLNNKNAFSKINLINKTLKKILYNILITTLNEQMKESVM